MHMFVVNETTLPVALKYGFVGTTARNPVVDWSDPSTLHWKREHAQAWLYADVCGVHHGDEIFFYLEKPNHDVRLEGGSFLGIFKCLSKAPFRTGTPTPRPMRKDLRQSRPKKDRKKTQNESESAQTAEVGLTKSGLEVTAFQSGLPAASIVLES